MKYNISKDDDLRDRLENRLWDEPRIRFWDRLLNRLRIRLSLRLKNRLENYEI